MKRQDLIKLIKECRPLLKTATPAQKVKILALIREGYRKLNQPAEQLPYLLVENEKIEDLSVDYLEEK